MSDEPKTRTPDELLRAKMVRLHRAGLSAREIARKVGRDKNTVQKWIRRAGDERLDRVDFSDGRASRVVVANRTDPEVEACILATRRFLREESDLGEYGAAAIRREMERYGCDRLPAVSTINEILKRNGCFDGKRRHRRPAPPPVWYLPDVRDGLAEIDYCDFIEDLRLPGELGFVHAQNLISQWGSLANSWVMPRMTSQEVARNLLSHWKIAGRPDYVQFDNGPIFCGPPKQDQLGLVIRMSLELGLTVVFTIPRRMGPQAKIERFNRAWKDGIWKRWHFESWNDLRARVSAFISSYRDKRAASIAQAPSRTVVPADWQPTFPEKVTGKIIFLRITNNLGEAFLLGRKFLVDEGKPNRQMRCEVDLTNDLISFYYIRRSEPMSQQLIATVKYQFPRRKFGVNFRDGS